MVLLLWNGVEVKFVEVTDEGFKEYFLGYNNILFHDDNAFSDGVAVSKVKILLKEVLTFFNFYGIIYFKGKYNNYRR